MGSRQRRSSSPRAHAWPSRGTVRLRSTLHGRSWAARRLSDTTVYGATKGALLSLVRTLSGELLSRGIRVNAISPGPIQTPLYDKLGLSDADRDAFAAAKIPLGRFGIPQQVASAVVFLASDKSAFSVGSELLIAGGLGSL